MVLLTMVLFKMFQNKPAPISVKNILRQIRVTVVFINSSTCSKAFVDFGYFLCVKKPFKYLYRNAYHKLCKI